MKIAYRVQNCSNPTVNDCQTFVCLHLDSKIVTQESKSGFGYTDGDRVFDVAIFLDYDAAKTMLAEMAKVEDLQGVVVEEAKRIEPPAKPRTPVYPRPGCGCHVCLEARDRGMEYFLVEDEKQD